MFHPDLTARLAQEHFAELHAEAARSRLIRRLKQLRRSSVEAEPARPALSVIAGTPQDREDATSDRDRHRPRVA